jgi:succinyl-diaminopimelate desuccinylase
VTPAIAPADLLRDLIRCPSVTPEDGGALRLLADVLQRAGFEVACPVFREPGMADVTNLYARIGTGRPCLAFAGHTDVVPPGDLDAWRHPPFAGEVADGFMFGRGACDMKGGIAAAVAAVLAYLAECGEPPGSIAFLITGDEEGPAVNGTPKLLAWARERGEHFDHCVLGEPTSTDALGDMIKIGRRGSLSGTLTVHGTQGHVAYPHRADNPIPSLLRLLAALLATPLDAGTAHFDPSNLEIVTVDVGNPSMNVIPATARARFNVRFNDLWTPKTLSAEIGRRLAAVAPPSCIDLAFLPCNALAFRTEPGPFVDLVREAIRTETGQEPVLSTTGGTSDARFIVADCPVVECGLVGRTMHSVDECVSLADLAGLTRIYGGILRQYFPA